MWTVCVLLVTCAASAQSADDQVAPLQTDPPEQIAPLLNDHDDDSSLRVEVKALAMFLAPGGRFIFPGTFRVGESIDVEAINLDSPRLSPGIEIDASLKQWRIRASYISFDQSDQGARSPTSRRVGDIDITKGDELVSSLRFDWGQVLVGRVIYDRAVGENSRFQVTAGAGVRFYDISTSVVRIAGGRADADPTFVEPILGTETRFTYREAYTFRLAIDAGISDWSDKTTQSWSITLESSVKLHDRVSAQFGYRILTFNLEEGDGASAFRFDGSLAGLYAGVSFAF